MRGIPVVFNNYQNVYKFSVYHDLHYIRYIPQNTMCDKWVPVTTVW